MNAEIITGDDAGEIARRKSRYGHKDWLFWVDRHGQKHASIRTVETIKAAMLDCGTQNNFILYHRSDGIGLVCTWSMGAMWLRNIKSGVIY